MNEVKKVLFIINKFSGTGYSPQLEGLIVTAAKKHNVEASLEFTQSPGHATQLAIQGRNDGANAVVAVGGDGTLNEVAQGLVGTNVPMGIVPKGSGNGLARHLNIPLATDTAIQNVFSGLFLDMDTFTMNGKLSLNVSGIGFDGHIANLFGGTTRRGLAGYTRLAVTEFLAFKEFKARVITDEQTFEHQAFIVALANSSQYGNNAFIAPAASVSDGILHLNVLKKVPLYRFDFVYAFFQKAIDKSPFCDFRTITRCRIETETPVPYHVDGEPCGVASEFNIQIQPSNLSVVVPAKSWRGRTL